MADSRVYWPSQPLWPVGSPQREHPQSAPTRGKGTSFAEILGREERKVSFSQHALQRLRDRDLELGEGALTKLDDTVAKMAQKGVREALIYLNDVALIVSVANRTVITAMDGASAKDNIFTNIDSAAIL